MTAYTVAREGEGYRFNVSEITKGASNSWLLPVVALSAVPASILAAFTFGLAFILWLVWLFWSIKHLKAKARRGPTYGKPVRTFTIDGNGVVLKDGRIIPRNRINAVDIKNEYGGAVSPSPFVYTMDAGGAASIATGMGTAIASSRALRSYYVTVQYGGSEERLAEKLDEMAATGLQADIIRALQGQKLD